MRAQGSRTRLPGFSWWELDVSYYALRGLSAAGVVWDVRTPPRQVRLAHLQEVPDRALPEVGPA